MSDTEKLRDRLDEWKRKRKLHEHDTFTSTFDKLVEITEIQLAISELVMNERR